DGDLHRLHQIIGIGEIVERLGLDHDVIDPLLDADTEAECVLTFVALEEQEFADRAVGPRGAVLNTAAHAEQRVEFISRVEAVVADEAMPQAGVAGGEAAIHAASRMKRLAVLDVRAVENLDRIAAWVLE